MPPSTMPTSLSETPEVMGGSVKGMLSKVPEVTVYFWIIKILCTTVGETAADFLNVNLGLGLTGTSVVMGALFLVVTFFQLRAKKYIPGLYWLTVVLISIFGTLVTDNLTDHMGIPLEVSTAIFTVALAVTFALWYAKEGTLSIRSILTRRREVFYWLAVLFTFALGTAAGDLMAERLGLGYLVTGLIVCVVIAAVIVAWRFRLDAVLAFWIAYILTRPLGASLGDYLTQTPANGGLGFGAQVTTAIFTAAILATVAYLAVTKRDLIPDSLTKVLAGRKQPAAVWQLCVVVPMLVVAAGWGYQWRHAKLLDEARVAASPASPLGDVSGFRRIAEDTLGLVRAGSLPEAKSRIADLESAWDDAEAHVRPMNEEMWSAVDGRIDDALRNLRAVRQDAPACCASLESLIAMLNTIDNRK